MVRKFAVRAPRFAIAQLRPDLVSRRDCMKVATRLNSLKVLVRSTWKMPAQWPRLVLSAIARMATEEGRDMMGNSRVWVAQKT
jgi:hypothetical protein